MVRDNPPLRRVRGNERRITSGDLTETTVNSDNWIELWSLQSTNSLKYVPGYGVENRQRGNAGFADLDLEATGNGSGNDGDAIDGDLRWAVYNDAGKNDLAAVGPKLRSETLRGAVSDDRTEKPFVAMRKIGAPFDGYIAFEIKADSASDGREVEADDADHTGSVVDVGIPYAEVRA